MANENSVTIGKVIPTFKGDWNANTSYSALDVVVHKNTTYVAETDILTGTEPKEGTGEWSIMARGAIGPQGERGKQVFKSSSEYYDQNSLGHWWSDLTPAVSSDNPPKIGDTIITSSGDVFQINAVNVGDGGGGGGTFGVGGLLGNIKGPQGPKGDTGDQGPKGDMDLSQITVGGRNLLLGTADWSGDSARWEKRGTVTNNPGTYRGMTVASTSGAWTSPVYKLQNAGILQVGKTYTFSTYVRNTSDTDTKVAYYYDNGITTQHAYSLALPAHTDWARVFVTFKVLKDPTTSTQGLRWEGQNALTNGQIQFAGYKLEEGNVPTDWTPAPEDINNKVGNIKVATPYQYGAVGDGVADDTNAIQAMLNDWHNRTINMSGDFRITSPLTINNSAQIDLTGKLIVDGDMDYAIIAHTTSGISGGGIGELDLNNRSGGIKVTNNAVFTPTGFRIQDIASNKAGIYVDKNPDSGDTYGYVHLRDVTMHNLSQQDGSIGVYAGRDSIYNNLETINLEIGFKIYGWDNFIDGFHPWNDIPGIVKKGVGIYLEASANDTYVANYYNDTMKYGFILDADTALTVSNMLSMWNTEFFNDTLDPGHPFALYYSNDKLVRPGSRVTLSGAHINQDPSQNGNGKLTPILSSITDNLVNLPDFTGDSNWWNLPLTIRPIADGDDMNTYSDAGSHVINGAKNLVNYPSGASAWATLEVENINDKTATQTLKDSNSQVFIRSRSGSAATWSAWRNVSDPGDPWKVVATAHFEASKINNTSAGSIVYYKFGSMVLADFHRENVTFSADIDTSLNNEITIVVDSGTIPPKDVNEWMAIPIVTNKVGVGVDAQATRTTSIRVRAIDGPLTAGAYVKMGTIMYHTNS